VTNPPDEQALEIYRRASALSKAGRPGDALALFDQVIARHPQFPQAHVGRGLALAATGANEAAVLAVAQAVMLDPRGAAPMLVHLGYEFLRTGRPSAANAAFSRLLVEQPGHLAASQGRIMALIGLGQFEDALPLLASLRASMPGIDYLAGMHFHAQLQCCDWRDYDSSAATLGDEVRRGMRVDTPHTFIAHSDSPALQRLCAQIYVADRCAPDAPPVARRTVPAHPRLKVAYLSSDFRDHAVAQLLVSVFEAHDKQRFETYAFSSGPNDASELRQRLIRSFDRFIDVNAWSDHAIAMQMAEFGIHVAIDLGGHSSGGRTRVLSFRPAPLQMSFLGYPGTLGASYVDYLIADSIVVPPEQREHYTEQLIYLPDTFLPTEGPTAMAPVPTRAAAGLPDTGIVFCCFNAPHKISPAMFALWMRVLKSVPHSVLWLRDASQTATRNLSAEAARHGVDPGRLVFAARTPTRAEHYARFSLADLFLDTSPYNAHTTAAEALRLGVPVITYKGSTFAGRVAASLLNACAVAELAADTLPGYERLAIELALDSDRLAHFKERVRDARSHSALFDPIRYCRHLEAALTLAWSRYERGESTATFSVERASSAAY
jgi:predicted O-linked N-acetylglucosamine transferase (SPINDLY family)